MHNLSGYYALWPPFAITLFILCLFSVPVFRILDAPPTIHPGARRIRTIDGLRGYLALAVVFHHAAILRLFLERGTSLPATWTPPPSRFYSALGPVGVSTFFMITGYLFWSRLIKERGRSDWYKLYVGRVFRIGPLYLFAVGLATTLDHFARYNYVARMSGAVTSFPKEIASVALLGLSVYPDRDKFLVGVTWSIQYEWIFYAGLPLLASILMVRRFQGWIFLIFLTGCFVARVFYYRAAPGTRTPAVMASLFLIGMLSAWAREVGITVNLPDWVSSLLVLVLLMAVLVAGDVYTPLPVLLLGGMFYLIVSGSSVFRSLTIYPAVRLGDISYGIYLLQGLVLSLCFRPAICRMFALSSPWGYWTMTLVAVVSLLLLATVTYLLIERPGIEAGRRVAKLFRSDRTLKTPLKA